MAPVIMDSNNRSIGIPFDVENNPVVLHNREMGDDGEIVSSGQNTRKMRLDGTLRIVGMTDAKDKALRKAVHRGEIVKDHGEYTCYYLDAKIERRPN